jgi:hypothetical protein
VAVKQFIVEALEIPLVAIMAENRHRNLAVTVSALTLSSFSSCFRLNLHPFLVRVSLE